MKTIILVSALMLACLTGLFSQNHPPVAVNDTVTGILGFSVDVNVLKNDYDPDGDSIYVAGGVTNYQLNDSTWRLPLDNSIYTANYNAVRIFHYLIKDQFGLPASGFVVVKLRAIARFDFLNVNNISALISPFGNHFWDLDSSRFEVPKGSGKHAIFNHALWIGGLDSANMLLQPGEGMIHFTGFYLRR